MNTTMDATPTPPTKKAAYPAKLYPSRVPWFIPLHDEGEEDEEDAVLCWLVMRGFALIHLGLSAQSSDCCTAIVRGCLFVSFISTSNIERILLVWYCII